MRSLFSTYDVTEDGRLLAQSLLRDPAVIRALRGGWVREIEEAVAPHGLDAAQALVLLEMVGALQVGAPPPGRN